jgi:ribosomal protein S18 acetylase RimI-like enzyme
MTDLRVRRYEDRDKEAVWRVHERAFRAALPEFSPAVDRDLRDVPGSYLAEGEFLVGERAGEVVACGGFLPVEEATVELKRLRVLPKCWRQGYGRALVGELERRAREEGYERVVLDTSEYLEPAQAFYRSLGYHQVDTEHHEPWDVQLQLFEKRL